MLSAIKIVLPLQFSCCLNAMKLFPILDFFFGILGNDNGPDIKNDNSNSIDYGKNNKAFSNNSISSSSNLTDISLICTPVNDTSSISILVIITSFDFHDTENCLNDKKDDDENCRTDVNQHGFSITGVGTIG